MIMTLPFSHQKLNPNVSPHIKTKKQLQNAEQQVLQHRNRLATAQQQQLQQAQQIMAQGSDLTPSGTF